MISGLVLFAVCVICDAQNVVEGNFRKLSDTMLNSSVLLVSTASRIGCASECLRQSACWSLSYEKSTRRCLLHDTDDVTKPASLVPHPGFSYYRRLRRVSGCEGSPGACQNGGTCIDTEHGIQCQCPGWRYEGRTCQDRISFYIQNMESKNYMNSTTDLITENLHRVNMIATPHVDGRWYEVDVPSNKVRLRAETTGMYLGCTAAGCYGTTYGSDPATVYTLEDNGSDRQQAGIKDVNATFYVCVFGGFLRPIAASGTESFCKWNYIKTY